MFLRYPKGTPVKTATKPASPSLQEVAVHLIAAKQELKRLEEEVKEAQAQFLALASEDKVTINVGQAHFILTVVRGQRKNYLADLIKSTLSPGNWKKVQKTEVDRAKLEACLKAGDFVLPDECVEITPISPFVKVTEWAPPISRAS